MSDQINDGGPAFPVSTGDPSAGYQVGRLTWQFPGMSLRDHFAGLALQALIAKDGKDGKNCGKAGVPNLVRFAYEYADTMILHRAAAAKEPQR